jgi:FkbM family methyltransferase
MSFELLEQRGDLWWPKGEEKCYNWTKIESDLPEYLMQHVPDKNVMVQAGGNMGWFTKIYAKEFNRVYVFEPDNINFLCLTMNNPERHVMKYQACIGNERNLVSVTFREYDRGKNHIAHGRDLEKIAKKGIQDDKIPTLLVDDLNLDACSYIHLDIEGFEWHALNGAEQTIKKFQPIIAIEDAGHGSRYGKPFNEIESYLAQFGYKIIDRYRYEAVFSV